MLTCARLSIRENGSILSGQHALDDLLCCAVIHGFLRSRALARRAQHAVEREAPFARLIVHAAVHTGALLAKIHTDGLASGEKGSERNSNA